MSDSFIPPTSDSATPVPQPVIDYPRPGAENLYLPVVVCRVLAIWMLAQGILQLTYPFVTAVAALFDPSSRRMTDLVVMTSWTYPGIFWLGLGLILWWRAPRFARRISGGQDVFVPEIPEGDRLLRLLLVVVGVFVLVQGVSEMSGTLFVAFRQKAQNAPTTDLWNSRFFGEIVKTAAGLWLVLGTEGAARLIQRVRHGPEADAAGAATDAVHARDRSTAPEEADRS